MATPGSFGVRDDKKAKKGAEGAKPPKVRKKLPGPFHESLKPTEGEGQLDNDVPEFLKKSWAQWETDQKFGQKNALGNPVAGAADSDNEPSDGEAEAEVDPFGFAGPVASTDKVASPAQPRPRALASVSNSSTQKHPVASKPSRKSHTELEGTGLGPSAATLRQYIDSVTPQTPELVAASFVQEWSPTSGSSAATASASWQDTAGIENKTYHEAAEPNTWNQLNTTSSFSLAEPLAPSVWESAEDPASGCIYYFNRSTGERTWECPPEVLALSEALEKVKSAAQAAVGTELAPDAIAAALLAETQPSRLSPVVLPPVAPVAPVILPPAPIPGLPTPKSSPLYPGLGPKIVPPPASMVGTH